MFDTIKHFVEVGAAILFLVCFVAFVFGNSGK